MIYPTSRLQPPYSECTNLHNSELSPFLKEERPSNKVEFLLYIDINAINAMYWHLGRFDLFGNWAHFKDFGLSRHIKRFEHWLVKSDVSDIMDIIMEIMDLKCHNEL